ncbi:hypothetical protein R1flu_006587 [Riccia fluitans]|uniref:Fungal lipase-type domain-containing protein n=1 Tax=Riccia fluitans TaxID=41844 RepID=A0ABD1YX58_9MARC
MILTAAVGYAIHKKRQTKKEERFKQSFEQSSAVDHGGGPSVIGGNAGQGYQYLENYRDHLGSVITNYDSGNEYYEVVPNINDPKEQTRIILANLIQAMYQRGSDKPDYSQLLEHHYYEHIPLERILTNEDLQRCGDDLKKEEKYKYFGVLRKRNLRLANPVAPEWVVAIRGTDVKSLHDLRNDLKIALERLHTSSTVELLKIVVSRLVKTVDPGCRQSRVAVTGHSLGASHAMVVTRELALEGYPIESHLFNPPFATIPALGRRWIRKLMSPVLGFSKAQRLVEKLSKFESTVSTGFNFLLDGGETMRKQFAEYKVLARWCPHLYLNKHDPVCQLYISHFTKRRKRTEQLSDSWYSFGSAFLRATLGDAQSFHLLPRASCCIANTDKYRPWIAHSLSNWTRHDLPLIIREPNLVVETNEKTREVTVKVFVDGVEGDVLGGEEFGKEEDHWLQLTERNVFDNDDDHAFR